MIRLALFLGLFWLAACSGQAAPAASLPERPARIVSLDYCADQYVLKMVGRERILAVSAEADRDFSYLRKDAIGIPVVRPNAEAVLALKPDLVVRSFGGGPNAVSFFERAGIPVLQVGWASDLDGVKRVTLEMAAGLGAAETGDYLVADMNKRLAALASDRTGPRTLYMTPGGVTSGTGTLVHEILLEAGLDNFLSGPGWQDLPLERLVREQPDMIAFAAFDSHKTPWSSARHPIARRQVRDLPVVNLQGAWTSCGGWYLVDAIEALAEAKP